MDVLMLNRYLPYFCQSGHTITIEECSLIQNSLGRLQEHHQYLYMYFWGKLFGLLSDYYIAYGTDLQPITSRKFYYSKNCIDWYYMTLPYVKHMVLTEHAVFPLQGDPCLVVDVNKKWKTLLGGCTVNTNDENPSDSLLDEISAFNLKKETSKKLNAMEEIILYEGELKEEDRVATIIQNITYETTIAPRGSIMKLPNEDIVRNPGFRGIAYEDSLSNVEYIHSRYPHYDMTTNLIQREICDPSIDFLDAIDIDIPPNSCWGIQRETNEKIVFIKSLRWPGAVFFHKLESPEYGNFYIGYGRRNWDLPFML